MKTVIRVLCLSIGFSLGVAAPTSLVSRAFAQKIDLGDFVAIAADVNSTYFEATDFLERSAEIDYQVSAIFLDERADPEVDAVIDAFEAELGAWNARSRTKLDSLRRRALDLPHERSRLAIGRTIESIEVLYKFLDRAPSALRALLVAARERDEAEFNRLSNQSLKRTAALMRTENALIDIQLSTAKESHPGYWLRYSYRATNETLALSMDFTAQLFDEGDLDVTEVAAAMRHQIKLMRGYIEKGDSRRKLMVRQLSIVAARDESFEVLRDVIRDEFAEAFTIEAEMADHLDAIVEALESIDYEDLAKFESLDETTTRLINRRIVVQQRTISRLKAFTEKQ